MRDGHIPTAEPLTMFVLHYLGGSAREWHAVATELRSNARIVALDLPGFGASAQVPGYSVAEMAAFVARTVVAHAPRRWALIGHSMGAKVAAVVAREAEDGAAGLDGLIAIVTVAGSPPAPEPMDEQQRQTMLRWFAGSPDSNRADAERYVAANSGDGLGAADAALAVADALRANREAWVHWLECGSREDWADRVGVLRTPALVVAGADDEQLGPKAQRALMAPHFARVRSATISDAKHLLPLERAQQLAALIDEHVTSASLDDTGDTFVPAAYRALIGSSRVSRKTRDVLTERGRVDDPAYEPAALDRNALAVLRAVIAGVVPQDEAAFIDLAARIDAQLHAEIGDGWRFAALPPDAEAYRAALRTLDDETRERYGRPFAVLDDFERDAFLARIADGGVGSDDASVTLAAGGDSGTKAASGDSVTDRGPRLTRSQMRAWFEDVRADAVKLYLAHPATLARLGYSGIANGGDGEPKSGFARLGAGEREAWEPAAVTPRAGS